MPSCAETFQKLLRRLEELGTAYEINKADEWIDLAPQTTRREDWSEAQLCRQFERCHVPWQELRGGKLYSCNYSSYAIVAGLSAEHPADSFVPSTLHRIFSTSAKAPQREALSRL